MSRRHHAARSVDRARTVAFDALRAITAEGAYANLVLADLLERNRLSTRDAAFATELVFGTSRMQGSYDLIVEKAGGRLLSSMQPALVDVLRLGTHQLLGMRIPTHAAVDATVNLAASRIGERVAGVVNAIMRKIAAYELSEWLNLLSSGGDKFDTLAIQTGHPRWIVEAYADLLPKTQLREALVANNVAAAPTLVVRPGLAEMSELLEAGAQPTRFSPWGAVRPGNPAELPAVRDGRAGVQDEGSQLVCLAASRTERPEGDWLDLCAGPGGKAALLRGLIEPAGRFFLAAEVHPHRARLVEKALSIYDPSRHQVIVADGTCPSWSASFALVMADVPCSGIGALRRRPEARWRNDASIIDDLVPLQRKLLDTAISSAKPNGVIAYATCSPHRAETVDVVYEAITRRKLDVMNAPALLGEVPDVASRIDSRFVQLWPHVHGTDAMFLALLRRSSI